MFYLKLFVLQGLIPNETIPVLFQPEQTTLPFVNSPVSSDGNISDAAYSSPLSNSSVSEAFVNSPPQPHTALHPSDVFVNDNELLPLAEMGIDNNTTLESLLQLDTCTDVKLDLGKCMLYDCVYMSADVAIAEIEMADRSSLAPSKAGKIGGRSKHIGKITEEEKALLALEGITLPTDVPLTKVNLVRIPSSNNNHRICRQKKDI